MPIGNTDNHKQIYVDHLHFLVIFYCNLGNRLSFMCSPPLKSINFIVEDRTLKKRSVAYLIFMCRLIFIFRILI